MLVVMLLVQAELAELNIPHQLAPCPKAVFMAVPGHRWGGQQDPTTFLLLPVQMEE